MSELARYWESRYAAGGDSGAGSRGATADAKAAFINDLVVTHGVMSIVDWGCGDGAQAALLKVEDYFGIDMSPTAVVRCLTRCPDRQFVRLDPTSSIVLDVHADLALSMDVLFHLVDDNDFFVYLARLFGSAVRFVCIYSTDFDAAPVGHMRRRHFTTTIRNQFPEWRLIEQTHPESADPEEATFHVYERTCP